ncbi:hypothetical protein BGW36DRAFT_373326 [Talaromyces proteolyticus]|uniref:Zn(2)-C6 fungal-type domain-containing protein n=1 Tax=Talaromyces proteolyticus TaxID=1131652 RepID=A0AAD4KYB8_9EURO|nr:uncharacterized protein BGW36DRAFT_373326 [Talaromyces proteolyticus]KAH8700080.1 hypothetical protein BGW36DRAFT_373326 [Talaromyces proteolyticus]
MASCTHRETRRKRETCIECSLRQQRCDRQIPCERCEKRGVAERCTLSWDEQSDESAIEAKCIPPATATLIPSQPRRNFEPGPN